MLMFGRWCKEMLKVLLKTEINKHKSLNNNFSTFFLHKIRLNKYKNFLLIIIIDP